MAVIDQDNFSNISWHSEQNGGSAAASNTQAVHHEPNSPEYVRNGPDDGRKPGDNTKAGMDNDELDHSGGEILDCTVSDPHKENDGTKDAYVSYLITTNVCAILSIQQHTCLRTLSCSQSLQANINCSITATKPFVPQG